jgi:hypothetical protein
VLSVAFIRASHPRTPANFNLKTWNGMDAQDEQDRNPRSPFRSFVIRIWGIDSDFGFRHSSPPVVSVVEPVEPPAVSAVEPGFGSRRAGTGYWDFPFPRSRLAQPRHYKIGRFWD